MKLCGKGECITNVSGEDVRVDLVHVGVNVVSHHMLVGPYIHGHSSSTVIDSSQQLPDPRLVGDRKMTGERMGDSSEWDPLMWTPLGQKKVSLLERCPHFRANVYVSFGDIKGVLISGVKV